MSTEIAPGSAQYVFKIGERVSFTAPDGNKRLAGYIAAVRSEGYTLYIELPNVYVEHSNSRLFLVDVLTDNVRRDP